MRVIASDPACINGNCPTIYLDEGRVMVQGTLRTRPDVTLGPGEALVEIPLERLLEAARCLTSQNS
jgi:hypothetical protein